MGIDDALSFAGGLFGAVTPIFVIIMMAYNKHTYELKAASILIKQSTSTKNIQENDYNFVSFVMYLIYFLFAELIGCEMKRWKDSRRVH